MKALPTEAQLSTVYGLIVEDLDGDGTTDIVTGGNYYNTKPEVGRYDASYGTFLKGLGKGDFIAGNVLSTGLLMEGEVRTLKSIKAGNSRYVVASRNNDNVQLYKINK